MLSSSAAASRSRWSADLNGSSALPPSMVPSSGGPGCPPAASSSPPPAASTMSSPYITPAATAAAAAAAPPAILAAFEAPCFLAAGGGAGAGRPPVGVPGAESAGGVVWSVMMVSLGEAEAASAMDVDGWVVSRGVEAAACAAPEATTSLGSKALSTGRPRCPATISATSGIRDPPPDSTTPARSLGVMPAAAIVRSRACKVSVMYGRSAVSNSSRVMRTDVSSPGMTTLIDASLLVDKSCFATVHADRSRATARRTSSSLRSSCSNTPPSATATCLNTSWSNSAPPQCSSD